MRHQVLACLRDSLHAAAEGRRSSACLPASARSLTALTALSVSVHSAVWGIADRQRFTATGSGIHEVPAAATMNWDFATSHGSGTG